MAGSGTARSAGVAYVDLAVGDTRALVDGIAALVRQAAENAQEELTKGFDVSGHTGSFESIVDAATSASEEAGEAISKALVSSASEATEGISESIVSAVTEAASAASGSLTSTLGDAGREAGEQLALNFEDATRDIQLTLFDEEAVSQASEAAREAATQLAEEFSRTLGMQMSHDFDQSNASLGSVFSSFHLQGLGEEVSEFTDSLTGGLRFAAAGIGGYAEDARTALVEAGREGSASMGQSFEEFKTGLTYSIGTWGIGYAIGNAITTGVSSAFNAAKSAVIDFNSEMQSAQISFDTLLGSSSAATSMLSQLKSFSLGTPFQFENLVEDSQHLLALGISAQNVIPDLTGLGDAVSALGGDSSTLDSVTQVFGEMQSKGQIMETQIRELQIRGIPALQILASEYGVSTTQMAAMIKAGKVMADDALPRLIDGMEKGTKTTAAMGGEMAKQSLTFKGSVSNLKDGLTQFAAGAFKPVFDSLNGVTAKMAGFASGGQLEKFVAPISNAVGAGLKSFGGFITKLFDDLKPAAPVIKDLIDNMIKFSIVKQIFEAVGPTLLVVAQAIGAIGANKTAAHIIADLVEGFIMLKGAQEAWNIVMAITDALMEANPLTLIVEGVILLAIGFVALYQHVKVFRDVVNDLGDVVSAVWHGIVVGFDFVKDGLTAGFRYVAGILESAFKSGPAQSVIGWLIEQFQLLRAVVVGEVKLIGSILGWLWTDVLGPIGFAIIDSIKTVGAIFTWLWKEIISPVVDGIWFALRLLFVIVFTLLVTPFVIAYHLIEAPIMALWNDVLKPFFDWFGDAAKWLWKNALEPFGDFVSGLFSGKLTRALVSFWKDSIVPGFQDIGKWADWLWKNALVPFGHGVSDVLSDLGDAFSWVWKNAINPVLQDVSTGVLWLWHDVLVPVGNGIGDVASWIGSVFTWLWKNAIGPALSDIADGANWLWVNILKPVFDAIGTAAKWLYTNFLKPAFDDFISAMKDVGTWAHSLYEDHIAPVFSTIGSVISKTLTDIKSGFKTAVDGISSVWNGLVDTLKVPVRFLVDTVYTNGIEEVWNFIAAKVGIPLLPDAAHFADGGIIGGPQSAGDWIPFYGTAGEGVLTLDEMAALGGPAGFNALRASLGGGGQGQDGHFASGGILGSIWSGIKGAGSVVAHGVTGLESYASRIVSGGLKDVASDMLKPILSSVNGILPQDSMMKSLLVGIPHSLVNGILGYFGGQDKKANAAATAGMSGDVAGWISQAESAAGVNSSWTTALSQIIKSESGGNPKAINLTDSNAQAGDPSRGLMQTIMSTFEAYRLPSLPDDIYNPVANIVAGIRYIISRYGTVSNVPGIKSLAAGGPYVGYATGTSNAAPGWALVGENGPEWVKFLGGESVLTHGQSLKASQALSVPSPMTAPANTAIGSPLSGSGAFSARGFTFSPNISATVLIDGAPFEARISVKIDENNTQLAQILNGGITA